MYLGGAAGLIVLAVLRGGASPRGLTLADVNDDGLLDILTANRDASTVSLLAGTAPGLERSTSRRRLRRRMAAGRS